MSRVEALLRQARANLTEYLAMSGQVEEKARWSALYLPLSLLLGKHFTKCPRGREHDYKYVGTDYGGKRVNEHVVPLKCIINHLVGHPDVWQTADGSTERLRLFLSEHIVMANIPKGLDRVLPGHVMPNAEWWRPAGPDLSERQKMEAVWARYRSVGNLIMPWETGSLFEPFHCPARRYAPCGTARRVTPR